MPNAQVKPLILGGLGVSRASVSTLTGGGMSFAFNAESKFYIEFGGGFLIKTSPRSDLFLTIRYVSVALEGTSMNYTPVTFGIMF